MNRAAVSLALLVLCSAAPASAGKRRGSAPSKPYIGATVVIDGEEMRAKWNDGDSFKFTSGKLKGTKVRVVGYNTLENFGPVHRWGAWSPGELFELAEDPKDLVNHGTWKCSTGGERDGYQRLLVRCPDVAAELVSLGLAFVFTMPGEKPDAALLAQQHDAQRKKLGMWRKGVPPVVITSAHSVTEFEDGKAYDRVVDVKTGMSEERPHANAYETCSWVCAGPKGQESCLRFVPFGLRYSEDFKPPCLQ